jgi:hypothetical protein
MLVIKINKTAIQKVQVDNFSAQASSFSIDLVHHYISFGSMPQRMFSDVQQAMYAQPPSAHDCWKNDV